MKLLVVDDDEMARFAHVSLLSGAGYDTLEADDGHDALGVLNDENIGIVISDWMMPGMDGIELCQRIRKRKNVGYVYVIMLTSKTGQDDLLKGFKAGVDAYLNKPPDLKTLNAQIKVGIRIVKLERQLTTFANDMEKLAEDRAHQLIHADRMATLGMLSAGIAHEVNNPTTFISGNAQALAKFWPIQEKWMQSCPEDYPEFNKLMFIAEEMPKIIESIRNGARRITKIVSGLKSFSRQDKPKFIPYDLHQSINAALMLCQNALRYNIRIEKDFCENLPSLNGDSQQIEQVLVNLFNNAADAMEGMAQGTLIIRTEKTKEQVTIRVEDTGPGLSKEAMEKIWNPFFTTKPIGKGTGLGMSISKGIIESHNGDIQVQNRPEGGAMFVILFNL